MNKIYSYANTVKSYAKKCISKIMSYLPSQLPQGVSEFNKFADEIIELSGSKATKDSLYHTLATMVMHLGPQKCYVAKEYFVRSIKKASANQVAASVFQDVMQREKEAIKSAKEVESTKIQEIKS